MRKRRSAVTFKTVLVSDTRLLLRASREALSRAERFHDILSSKLVPALVVALHGVAFAQLHEVGDGSAGPVKAAHVTAELAAGAPAASPGDASDIALVLHLEPGWHVYWINAGDSGEAPSVDWVLPAGVTVGKMQFPTPKRLPLGPLMDYGYEGTAVFPFELKLRQELPVSDSVQGVKSESCHASRGACSLAGLSRGLRARQGVPRA